MLETPRWSHPATAVLLDFSLPVVPKIPHNFCFSETAIRVPRTQSQEGMDTSWESAAAQVLSTPAPPALKGCCQLDFFPLASTVCITKNTRVPRDLQADSTAAFQCPCLSVMQEETVLFRSGSVSVEISISTSNSVRNKVSREDTPVHYPSWDILWATDLNKKHVAQHGDKVSASQ